GWRPGQSRAPRTWSRTCLRSGSGTPAWPDRPGRPRRPGCAGAGRGIQGSGAWPWRKSGNRQPDGLRWRRLYRAEAARPLARGRRLWAILHRLQGIFAIWRGEIAIMLERVSNLVRASAPRPRGLRTMLAAALLTVA